MDEYVKQDTCDEREKRLDERFARDKEAISRINDNLAQLSELVTSIAALQKVTAGNVDDHEKRLRTLELQPAGKWDKLQTTIVTALASGLVGYMLSSVLKTS